jgi:hypothetical protein
MSTLGSRYESSCIFLLLYDFDLLQYVAISYKVVHVYMGDLFMYRSFII